MITRATFPAVAVLAVVIFFDTAAQTAGPFLFGAYHVPDSLLVAPLTGGFRAFRDTSDARTALESARRRGVHLVIQLAGGRSRFQNPDKSFSLALYRRRLERFRDFDFAPYVRDGTIFAHGLFDEPQDPTNWNGRPVPYSVVDSAAAVSKELFPSVPTTIGAPASWLAGGAPYRCLDFAQPPYTLKRGDFNQWMMNEIEQARRARLRLIFGLNVLMGGVNRAPLTAEQVRVFGAALAAVPDAEGLLLWKWDSAYFSDPGIEAALDSIYAVVKSRQPRPFAWKPFFTLDSAEGLSFTVGTVPLVDGGVPVLNITRDGEILLGYSGGPGASGAFLVRDNGRTYDPAPRPNRGPDGGFIYLPDGRIRFVTEEMAPGSTPRRRKSRVVSFISTDGMGWRREPGIRYQPGAADDSISSVVSVIQLADSMWRMYYVGDFYRTNGIRTAVSTDWGWNWTAESHGNILKKGDVDPYPVYLSNGWIRLYFRTGFGAPGETDMGKAGVACNDSPDGLHFDTLKTRLLIPDSMGVAAFNLDPAVIRFPNGDVACYFGAAPLPGSPGPGRLYVAWAQRMPSAVESAPVGSTGFELYQNYPNPVTCATGYRTTVPYTAPGKGDVRIVVYDALGRTTLKVERKRGVVGRAAVMLDLSGLQPGVYFYRLETAEGTKVRKMIVIK